MVRLHQIQELIQSGNLNLNSKNLLPETPGGIIWKTICNKMKKSVSKAICFDIGNLENLYTIKVDSDFCFRLPYKTCWFEFNFNEKESKSTLPRIAGSMCFEDETDNAFWISGISFWKSNIGWIARGGFVWEFNKMKEDGTMILKQASLYPMRADDKTLRGEFVVIQAFLQALNCSNIEKIRNEVDQKLQKKRIKNKKLPLFSYYTLHLKFPKTNYQGIPDGGHHAPPRVHLRRGHPRQYRPGKFTWVQACVIGATRQGYRPRGVIFKDYAADYKNSKKEG